MNIVKLKKLLQKKEEYNILMDAIKMHDIPIIITDCLSNIIEYKSKEKGLSIKTEIKYDNIIIGYVISEKPVNQICKLINYIVNNEIEKKTLAAEILDKYRELMLLYDISEKLGVCLDVNEVASLVIEEAMKYIPATAAALMILDEFEDKMIVAAEFNNLRNDSQIIKPNAEIIKSVMETGIADIANDLKSDKRFNQKIKNVNSMICAPIVIKTKIIGVVVFANKNRANYNSADLKLFNAIAFQASSVIESAKLYNVLEDTFFQTVKTLAETIEMRDPYTGGHTQRVMNYSMAIGEAMGLPKSELVRLKLAALMHDIGKIGIGDNILLKDGRLTDGEYGTMRKHTEYGAEILKNIKQLNDIVPGVRGHHERYDGGGYPDGLKGEEIILIGRIIAVADSFDAMTTDRPYRKALDVDHAIKELEKNAGTQFDPKIVNSFMKVYKEKGISGFKEYFKQEFKK